MPYIFSQGQVNIRIVYGVGKLALIEEQNYRQFNRCSTE